MNTRMIRTLAAGWFLLTGFVMPVLGQDCEAQLYLALNLSVDGKLSFPDGRSCDFLGTLRCDNLTKWLGSVYVIVQPHGKYLASSPCALLPEDAAKRGIWPLTQWGSGRRGWAILVTTAACEPVRLVPLDVLAYGEDVSVCFEGDDLVLSGGNNYLIEIRYAPPDFHEIGYEISSPLAHVLKDEPRLQPKLPGWDYMIRKDGSLQRVSDGKVCDQYLKKPGGSQLRFLPYLGGRKVFPSPDGRYVAVSGALHPGDNPNPDDLPCDRPNYWGKGWDSVFLIADVRTCRLVNVINISPRGTANDVLGSFSTDGRFFFAAGSYGQVMYRTDDRPGIPLPLGVGDVDPLVNPPAVFRTGGGTGVVNSASNLSVLFLWPDGSIWLYEPQLPPSGDLVIPVYADQDFVVSDVRGVEYLGYPHVRMLAVLRLGGEDNRWTWVTPDGEERKGRPKGFGRTDSPGYAYLPLPIDATDIRVKRTKAGGLACSYAVLGKRQERTVSNFVKIFEPPPQVLAEAKALAEGGEKAKKPTQSKE